jgi:hypothetical protein
LTGSIKVIWPLKNHKGLFKNGEMRGAKKGQGRSVLPVSTRGFELFEATTQIAIFQQPIVDLQVLRVLEALLELEIARSNDASPSTPAA